MFLEKGEEVFEFYKVLLLDDLRVDVGRAEGFDLSDQEVSYSFDGLGLVSEEGKKGKGKVNTLSTSFSISGPISDSAFVCVWDEFFFWAAALLSTSANTLTHASSMWPSDILETTRGDTLSSSTTGPSPFSTAFLFSNLTVRAVDLDWRLSMSADTAARSLRKLVRFDSTEDRISSQARIDRCRSSNLVLSRSSAR